MAHLWEPCLPGNEHWAKIPLFSSQGISWAGPPVNDCREEEINTSLPEADGKQEMFDFTRSPFSIKEDWILTQARWFFGTRVHHLLGLLAFWIKSLFLAPTTCALITGSQEYELRLSNTIESIIQSASPSVLLMHQITPETSSLFPHPSPRTINPPHTTKVI